MLIVFTCLMTTMTVTCITFDPPWLQGIGNTSYALVIKILEAFKVIASSAGLSAEQIDTVPLVHQLCRMLHLKLGLQ